MSYSKYFKRCGRKFPGAGVRSTDMSDRALLLVKPDAVERDLTGEVLRRVEETGLSIEQLRTTTPSRELVEEHYKEHHKKDFYWPLVYYITESRIHAAVISGENAASRLCEVAGETEPVSAGQETIRGSLGDDSYEAADLEGRALRNLVHASEPGDVDDELELWFPEQV